MLDFLFKLGIEVSAWIEDIGQQVQVALQQGAVIIK
jgi:hypothetical protein